MVHELDDADLDLVAALQLAPRAPINMIAEVIGVKPTTASRRLANLQERGVLRVIASARWTVLTSGNPYVVWIKCTPGRTRAVADALREVPEVQSIMLTTGITDLYCTIYPLPGTDINDLLTVRLPLIEGVDSLRSDLVLRAASEGFGWRLHRLDAEATAKLTALADYDPASGTAGAPVPELGAAELDALGMLLDDGRVSSAKVARELGISTSSAYRVVQSLLESGTARPRAEIEPALLGYPITALITLQIQPRHIPEALAHLSSHASARYTVMTAGPASVFYHGVFRDEEELADFTTGDLGDLPGVVGMNMSMVLRVLRRQWIDRGEGFVLGARRTELLPRPATAAS
ncbi:Lrp/AsnC family transcriptional regulator [Paeniglutamicibacter psychrophenolicus]|uniref:DNA-binding Lrp family transcriptional regulator n=1 Tax=Paeniglutamicibacter psychrophenolicus TaxID=257454 RepID=A0ABS4W9Q4_9MICC|nr:Lrp/AsnC family transcriptional regulator [Paeniglutamicibacter psychrophenolicus]MBP2372937.1 DNA-binding Lrp family transcriptional regulator [Paeniglutamicibacter psychrophenolicus]